ncbi:hypothetical protein [Streptomyces bacillaris]|uniref:hypothetical protein n=1 Tax=Streptomyces bacillaris TaxID=68179 RepID=UPI00345F1863
MPDPTQLSQPDEALRQARVIEEAGDLRQLLTRIANRLTQNFPDQQMREVNRLAYARQYAEAEHGYGTDMTRAVERALLRQMPQIDDRPFTRGEYALLLRTAAGRPTRAERVAELQADAAADYASRPARAADARTALALARAHGNAAASAR